MAPHVHDDPNPIRGQTGIGAVDKRRSHLAQGHVVQGLLHRKSVHHLGRERVPQAQVGEGLLGVTAGWHGIGLAQGDPVHLGVGEVLGAVHVLGIAGHDQHQVVGREIDPAGRVDEPVLLGPVHGLLVGRGKDVHGRTGFDLLEELAGRGEIDVDLPVRVAGLESVFDLGHGAGEAGRARDHDVPGQGRPPALAPGQGGQEHDKYRQTTTEHTHDATPSGRARGQNG